LEGRLAGEIRPIYAALGALLCAAVEAASREARTGESGSCGGAETSGTVSGARRKEREERGMMGLGLGCGVAVWSVA
jgi:hypothetical protein